MECLGKDLNNGSGVSSLSYEEENSRKKPSVFNFPQYITSTICEKDNVLLKGETITEKKVERNNSIHISYSSISSWLMGCSDT